MSMTTNVGIEGWVDCKRWWSARLTFILEMNIVMNIIKTKHLKDAIANGVLIWVTRLEEKVYVV